ncbi:MAG TPA: helix-turn-helix transcriptional regulator [Thermoanaerobaculia bacterium]|nr:helix-turn-helix transcriptional regulator [Thermoanaerobaculia bacterium]
MIGDAAIAPVAALLADPARVAMLWALSDGREISAGELALLAGVSASTASLHLAKLTDGGLVAVRPQGRHRHYRLARPELVRALEALAAVAPEGVPRTHRQATIGREVRAARTCYDHLAGRLGVQLTEALVGRGALISDGRLFDLTAEGDRLFADFGVDLAAARAGRRAFALACFDWSERVPHLAGGLGAALLSRLLTLGWIERTAASRAVQATLAGRRGLARTFGVDLSGA